MAETDSYRCIAAGPDVRARQNHSELSVLLRQAAGLMESTELQAANETLKKAIVRVNTLQSDAVQNLEP